MTIAPKNSRSRQPPISRAAGRLSGLRAGLLSAAAGQDPARKRNPPFTTRLQLLNAGKILAVKGLGGYHLACDARNPAAVAALRERKYRKEKPFAVMVRDLEKLAGWWSFRQRANTCSLLRSTHRAGAGESRVDRSGTAEQRTGRDASLHSVASLAVCGRRSGSSGHDQRQPIERADRLRGRRCAAASRRNCRRIPDRTAADRAPG